MAKIHSPEILIALGVSGVITTAVLSGKAALKANKQIQDEYDSYSDRHLTPIWMRTNKERVKHKIQLTWKTYIPPVASGTLTVVAIVASQRAGGRRTTAAVAAYSLAEKTFSEYREKVVEQIGEGKEQKLRDEIAQDRVNKNPPGSATIIVGTGHVLFREELTGRYFRSDMETLRRAQNDINALIFRENYVFLDEFYEMIGLEPTSKSDVEGWNFENNLELRFYAVIAPPNSEPCIVFEYNYTKVL